MTVQAEMLGVLNELKQGREFTNCAAILLWLETQPEFVLKYMRDAISEKWREVETGERQGQMQYLYRVGDDPDQEPDA